MTADLRRYGGEVARATAAGYAQVLFSESPLGGAFLLLGIAALSPRAAAGAVIAGGLATVVARQWRYPDAEWRRGLYGYAAALTGTFWPLLFAPTPRSWLVLVVAALLAPPLTRLVYRLLTPRNVPALALPALALCWTAWTFLPRPGAPLSSDPMQQIVASSLTLAGLMISSPLLALTAAVGAGVGLGVGGLVGHAWTAGILANTVPTAIAVGSVLLPLSIPTLVLAIGASAAAAVLWWLAAAVVALPLPVLVAPFNVVTLIAVAALASPRVRRLLPQRPAPLPLAAVGSPERARRTWLAGRRLHGLAANSRKLCVLTGAGISTAAGLPDFRGPSGLWTPAGRITFDDFVRSADLREAYWRQEDRFFRMVEQAQPTATHRALATMYRRRRISAIVTQNVDGLHQAAGLPARAVIELHGSIREAFCIDCGAPVPRAALSIRIAAGSTALYCPLCQGLLKGGSTMFGERVSAARLDAALRAVLASDLVLALGTSLLVTPASDLLRWAREGGVPLAIVNATPTPYDRFAAVSVAADVNAVVTELLEMLEEPVEATAV